MSTKLTIRDFLEEIIPALSAAGLRDAELRSVSADTRRRMGEGGTTKEWLIAMAESVAALDNPLAERAFMLAIDKAAA